MSSRYVTHQLSSGLMVSGPPEQPKERQPTIGSRAMPYTGGDIKKSGELGRMFDIPVTGDSSTRPNSGSRSQSGPLPKTSPAASGSGTVPRKTSGPLTPIQPTGLITSGPIRLSGGPEPSPVPSRKKVGGYGPAVTVIGKDAGYGYRVPRLGVFACLLAFSVGLAVGVFVLVVVKRVEILVAVAALLVVVGVLVVWNWVWGRKALEGFLRGYPSSSIDLRKLPLGQYIKVTGVVTCGSIPLETSYQRLSRCVYASTELYEYQGWNDKPASSNHKRFTWGLRHSERHVADFYISDSGTGTRFLVRAGNGAMVAPFVKPATVVDVTKENKELSPRFLSWLTDHNLSSDNRIMRLEEGYIKEGCTASVMGILQKHDNLFMIVPPTEMISTGCLLRRCLIPMYVEGLVLIGDQKPDEDVYLV